MFYSCTWTCRFGPLVRHWTMRFEARHRYFKKMAVQLGNVINVAYSLAMRHQRLKCYHSLDKRTIEGEEMETGLCQSVKPESIAGIEMEITNDTEIYRCVCVCLCACACVLVCVCVCVVRVLCVCVCVCTCVYGIA